MILPLNNFRSTVNGKHFSILTDSNLNCQSTNIIYLITCNICKLQYVGETKRSFETRIKEHLTNIKKYQEKSNSKGYNQHVYKHFCRDDLHKNTPLEKRIRFQIIEKIKTIDPADIDPADISQKPDTPETISKRRLHRELYWISKLRTAYPLGLNDMISAFGVRGKATDAGFKDYNHLRIVNLCDTKPPKNQNRKNRHRKKKRGNLTDDHFKIFHQTLTETFSTHPENTEKIITAKSRKFLTRFLTSHYSHRLNRKIRHLLETHINYNRKLKPQKKDLALVDWTVKFSHKIIDNINIDSILKQSELTSKLPQNLKNKLNIRKIFTFDKPTSSKILNYNKILRSTGTLSYLDITNMTCDCINSTFINTHFGHIITGDLQIIKNPDLRKLCNFGTKFRDNPIFNISKIKNQFKTDIEKLIRKISKKFKITISSLKRWKTYFLKAFNASLQSHSTQLEYKTPTLNNLACKKELKDLQEKYIITVVDKASGNYALTCKKFYFLKLAEELGLNNPTPGNDTYLYCPDNEQTVCNRLISTINKFNTTPPTDQHKIALLYQTPKFHKNPPKMRYIAGNINTITSQLDEKVAKILKMCKTHFRNLAKIYENFSGIKHCFDVETSTEVKDMFDGAHGKVNSISINDFSTLYTLFDHDHLLRNIKWLLKTLSKNSGRHCIKIDYKKARWISNANGPNTYTIGETLEMITFLVKETYIKAFGHIFQQVKGIIMGGKISGWLSDCSLMVDEFKYIRNKIKNGQTEQANKLKYFRRYRDDCTTLNCENFILISKDIYPPSLSLTQENDNPLKANVLDMEVNISNTNCSTKIFCKTDHFPFEVITFPFLESSIDNNLCYRVFYSQIIRYQRLCTHRVDFEERTKLLGLTLQSRGYKLKLLEKQFCRVIDKYIKEFQKWAIPPNLNLWFKQIFNEARPIPISLSQPFAGPVNLPNTQTNLSQP